MNVTQKQVDCVLTLYLNLFYFLAFKVENVFKLTIFFVDYNVIYDKILA
jgi:hypothetical protein